MVNGLVFPLGSCFCVLRGRLRTGALCRVRQKRAQGWFTGFPWRNSQGPRLRSPGPCRGWVHIRDVVSALDSDASPRMPTLSRSRTTTPLCTAFWHPRKRPAHPSEPRQGPRPQRWHDVAVLSIWGDVFLHGRLGLDRRVPHRSQRERGFRRRCKISMDLPTFAPVAVR